VFYRPYTPPFDETGVIINATILLPLAVFGIIANIVTIVVIATSPKLKLVANHESVAITQREEIGLGFDSPTFYFCQ